MQRNLSIVTLVVVVIVGIMGKYDIRTIKSEIRTMRSDLVETFEALPGDGTPDQAETSASGQTVQSNVVPTDNKNPFLQAALRSKRKAQCSKSGATATAVQNDTVVAENPVVTIPQTASCGAPGKNLDVIYENARVILGHGDQMSKLSRSGLTK